MRTVAGIHAVLWALLLSQTDVPAQSSGAECLQSVFIEVTEDISKIEEQCQLNRGILEHCRSATEANLMNEEFARNILSSLVEESCRLEAQRWRSEHEQENETCAKALENYTRDMQAYSAEMTRQLSEQMANAANGTAPPPPPAGSGPPPPGVSFTMEWCWGDCPPPPAPPPRMPVAPNCQIEPEPPCDREEVAKRMGPRAEAEARRVFLADFDGRKEALEHDCQEKKLRAEAEKRQREIQEAHEDKMHRRDERAEASAVAQQEAREARKEVREAAARGKKKADEVSARLGNLAPLTVLPAYAPPPEVHRPIRIQYGVDQQTTAGEPPAGAADADLAAFITAGAQNDARCARALGLIPQLKRAEADLRGLLETLERGNRTQERAAVLERLQYLEETRGGLEASSGACGPATTE